MKYSSVALTLFTMLAGCGDPDPACELLVDSVGPVMPNKHVTIMGSFTSGQPLILISDASGGQFMQIPCVSADDNQSADCDLSGYPAGTWDIGFAVSCFNNGEGDATYSGPKTVTIP